MQYNSTKLFSLEEVGIESSTYYSISQTRNDLQIYFIRSTGKRSADLPFCKKGVKN